MSLHDIYAVKIDTTVLGGQTQGTVQTGTQTRGEAADGAVYPRTQSIVGQNPGASFTTLAIAAALDAVGPTGLAIVGAGFSAYGQQHAEGGTRETGANHRQYLISKGIIVPTGISCDHQGDAQISYAVAAVYDGVNNPVIINDDVALPAIASDDQRFTIAKCTIAGVLLPDIRSWGLDFGIDVQVEGGNSDIWPTMSSIRSIRPVLTLRGIDIEWFKAANIPLVGKLATQANTTFYLRKRLSGGDFELDASAVHIKFNAAGLVHIDQPVDGNTNSPSEANLVLVTNFDGTNAPVVINTASAIT